MMYVKAVYARARLTDEQMKKVQALVDGLAKGQNPKMDWQAFGKLAEKIGGLLTDQQKEAMKAPYAAGGQGGFAPGTPVMVPAETPAIGAGTLTLSGTNRYFGSTVVLSADPTVGNAGGTVTINSSTGACCGQKPGEKKPSGVKVTRLPGGSITVNGGTLIIGGSASGAGEKRGEKKSSGVKVTQLPGGGIQVTITEGGEQCQATAAAEKARSAMEQAMKSARAHMREKVKRQHELAEQAWQASEKLGALGPDKKAEAHELWERLERIEGELRRTFEPAAAPFGPPGGAWMPPGAMPPGAMPPGAMPPGAMPPGAMPPGRPLMYWLSGPGPQPGWQPPLPMPMPGQPVNAGPQPPWTCPAIEQAPQPGPGAPPPGRGSQGTG